MRADHGDMRNLEPTMKTTKNIINLECRDVHIASFLRALEQVKRKHMLILQSHYCIKSLGFGIHWQYNKDKENWTSWIDQNTMTAEPYHEANACRNMEEHWHKSFKSLLKCGVNQCSSWDWSQSKLYLWRADGFTQNVFLILLTKYIEMKCWKLNVTWCVIAMFNAGCLQDAIYKPLSVVFVTQHIVDSMWSATTSMYKPDTKTWVMAPIEFENCLAVRTPENILELLQQLAG